MEPEQPKIPVGLGTKLGGAGALIGVIIAAVTAILGGDHSEEMISGLAFAAINLYAVVRGRMDQAAAMYRNSASPEQMNDASGMPDFDLPDEADLVEEFPEDSPVPEGAVEKPSMKSS